MKAPFIPIAIAAAAVGAALWYWYERDSHSPPASIPLTFTELHSAVEAGMNAEAYFTPEHAPQLLELDDPLEDVWDPPAGGLCHPAGEGEICDYRIPNPFLSESVKGSLSDHSPGSGM